MKFPPPEFFVPRLRYSAPEGELARPEPVPLKSHVRGGNSPDPAFEKQLSRKLQGIILITKKHGAYFIKLVWRSLRGPRSRAGGGEEPTLPLKRS